MVEVIVREVVPCESASCRGPSAVGVRAHVERPPRRCRGWGISVLESPPKRAAYGDRIVWRTYSGHQHDPDYVETPQRVVDDLRRLDMDVALVVPIANTRRLLAGRISVNPERPSLQSELEVARLEGGGNRSDM